MLFNAKIRGEITENNKPIKEHVETDLIVKVAHEVSEEEDDYLNCLKNELFTKL